MGLRRDSYLRLVGFSSETEVCVICFCKGVLMNTMPMASPLLLYRYNCW